MVDHALLHNELSALASTTADKFDMQEGLHQLGVTATAALGIDGAGVTLSMPDGKTEYVTATDPVTLHVEQQQDALRQGACVDAIEASEIIAVNDLAAEERWPEYTPVVLAAGFHAVAGVPVPFRGRNIGAINLYANQSRAWTTDEFRAARLLAELAAGYLINTHLLGQSQTLAAQLREALDSRIVIEQAKGVMCGRYGMSPDAAFEIIRGYARSHRAKIHDVAGDIVAGRGEMLGNVAAAVDDLRTARDPGS